MKAKNKVQDKERNTGERSMVIEELEHTNRKRKLQNKVLKKMVEHLKKSQVK